MNLVELALVLLPWMVLVGIVLVFATLVKLAKKRKSAVVAFGVLVHMFLPDPYVQRTIETVAEAKQEVRKQQDEDENLLEPDESSET
ncbi:hypothetical protein [Aliiglaciecola sp. LCG003]|uniref:hypothetical protein n=1 Tax=Aliiglaciecola sp. LCG003 TaxID=3053655 RepID=UPI00257371EB|nr:hypothetical protein [Aliiglaciecola sp. LCG003]WJG09028.1 hypothetical protein QR722_17120 [Aliiglaciecola sp. LCG003]